MTGNLEIKYKLSNPLVQRQILESLFAKKFAHKVYQIDTFLESQGSTRVKIRQPENELIVYDRPDQAGARLSTYQRALFKAEHIEQLIANAPVRGQVKKVREIYLVGQSRIHLDDVEQLGQFLEIEVVLRPDQAPEYASDEMERLLQQLQLDSSPDDICPLAYIDMLEARK